MSLNSNTESMEELLAKANAMPTADAVYAQGYNAALASLPDRVVEIGTEESTDYPGTWYWKKYDSGEARCYGRFDYGSVACTTSWGNSMYEKTGFYKTFPSGLFIDSPLHLDISVVSGNGALFVTQDGHNEITAQQTGRFTLSRPTSMTVNNVSLGFEVIGRWK